MNDVAEAQESTTKDSTGAAPKIAPWERLRQAREKQNLAPADIAKELKLDIRFVNALEAGQLDQLPQPVYTAGYIRAYARLVGLPPDDIVGDYASQETTSMPGIIQSREKIPARYRHVNHTLPKSFSVSQGQGDKKTIRLFIAALVIAVVLAIVWQVYSNLQAPEPELPLGATLDSSAPDAAGNVGQAPAPEQETPKQKSVKLAIPGQSTEVAGASGNLRKEPEKLVSITLNYSQDSWIDVRDATGKALIRRLGKAGGSTTVEGLPPFDVLLGFSPGVSIEYDGKPYDISHVQTRPTARFILDGSKPPALVRDPSAVTGGSAASGAVKATE
ncbi:MAG TPA: RodZ domain-containing protein [Gammaproteobacteria bacterium]